MTGIRIAARNPEKSLQREILLFTKQHKNKELCDIESSGQSLCLRKLVQSMNKNRAV